MNLEQAEKIVAKQINNRLSYISEPFIKNNYEIYLVGGIVRDIILGKNIDTVEYDLATNARPNEVKRLFRHVIPTGIKHGTVTVLKDKINYEVTTFRADGNYSDGRHPDNILFSDTIEDDLKRRDFTINAFAFNLKTKKLIDMFNGLGDLQNKIIRTIGRPDDRFQEDGLRLMRAIRFASVLGFIIEENTYRAVIKNNYMIKKVSMERIRDEFIKIIKSEKPSIGIELLRKTEILRYILPELLICYGVKQNKFHKYDVYHHILYSVDASPSDNLAVRLAALFHDISKPFTKDRSFTDDKNKESTFYNHEIIGSIVAKKIMKRFKFSNELINRVEKLVRNHMFYYTEEWSDSAVRRFIRKVGLDLLDDLYALRRADRVGNGTKKGESKHLELLKQHIEKILEEENAFSVKDLNISGRDVMKIRNIPPSPEVGKILNYLLEIVLDDPKKNTYDELTELIKKYEE